MRSVPELTELAMTCQANTDTEPHYGQDLTCGKAPQGISGSPQVHQTKATDLFGIWGSPGMSKLIHPAFDHVFDANRIRGKQEFGSPLKPVGDSSCFAPQSTPMRATPILIDLPFLRCLTLLSFILSDT